MGKVAFAAPVLEGKLDTWKKFNAELDGARHDDYVASRKRVGVTSERVWHQQTPMGDLAIVYVDGPGAESMMPQMAASQDPFDLWFKDQIKEIHGIDLTQPPAYPPPELQHEFDA